MSRIVGSVRWLVRELHRRNVIKVGVAYAVVGWLIIEVASTVLPTFGSPEWFLQALTFVTILGFPLVIVVAWAFELTSTGLEFDRSVEDPSSSPKSRLDLDESETEERRFQDVTHDHVARIAILPLDALSTEKEDQYLADGLTEDLVTLLSRTPNLFVIARNSCYVYKGKAIAIRQVAAELGVRYVVEGSARRFGEHIRVNIQLVDGETEEHVWAKRYDFSESELFTTQEEISQKICMQLSVPLIEAESRRAMRLPAEDIDAWLLTQRAILTYYFTRPRRKAVVEAKALLLEALEREPDYPYALAFHAHLCATSTALGITDDPDSDARLAFEEIGKACRIAPNDPMVLWCYGVVYGFLGDLDASISALETAVRKNPNDAHALADLGAFLGRAGRIEEARAHLSRVFSLSPNEPRAYIWHFYLGGLNFLTDVESALKEFERSISLDREYFPAWLGRIACLGVLERHDEARRAADELKVICPGMSPEQVRHLIRMGPIQDESLQEKIISVLEMAGLGEQ